MNLVARTNARLAAVRLRMEKADLPALLVSQITNIRWLTGFTGTNGFVLLTQTDALFATDSRYVEQAKSQVHGFVHHLLPTSAPEEVTAILEKAGASRIGFEAESVNCALYRKYREKLPPAIDLVPTEGIVDGLRMVKDAVEIEKTQAACRIADNAFDHILAYIKPGANERDVMLELEWFMRKERRADVAFDTIVASGPRSALPHGRAAERVMEVGDFVTLDFGAKLDGYNSDITRTVVLGEPTTEQRKVYQIVLDALRISIDAIRPGAQGKVVDAIGRDFIAHAGYGDYFGHGLGHSLGLNVHDGPGLSKTSEVTLANGMIITVEPGIYIPDWGGVRIEDDVVVNDDSPRVLTTSPRDLISL